MTKRTYWYALLPILALAGAMLTGGCGLKRGTYQPKVETETQWQRGVYLYSQNCAGCHGDDGEGDEDNPAIAGEGALALDPKWKDSERKVKFETAADVFEFVKAQMPPMEPGNLSDDKTWAILLYVLKQAQVETPEELTAENAASVKLR